VNAERTEWCVRVEHSADIPEPQVAPFERKDPHIFYLVIQFPKMKSIEIE